MKYFAMIDGQRTGPWELWQLPEAGVTPDTYVWCKGMTDWRKAEVVADVCRYYRQHLAGIEPEDSPYAKGAQPTAEAEKNKDSFIHDALHPQGSPHIVRNAFPAPPPAESMFEP